VGIQKSSGKGFLMAIARIDRLIIVGIIAVSWSIFQMYTGFFGVLAPLQQRAIHLTFALVLAYLITPMKKSLPKDHFYWDQLLLAILSACVGGYITHHHLGLWQNVGIYTDLEIGLAGVGILLTLEATRRITGLGLPLIGLGFIIYEMAGPFMPSLLAHPGFALPDILTYQFLSLEGAFGIALGVSSAFIFLFILYARFLQSTGGGQVFIDFATSLVGFVRGGPAKVAVVASCLFGCISGSAVANVVGTGTFTIPLMKKTGYKPHFAGAVEAVASSGGQFMPPIMGSSAFIIAEVLGIPYWKVALYAAVPAVLYYLAIFFMVDFEAAQTGLVGIKRSELPRTREVVKKGWPTLISPLVLIYLLAFLQWSPGKAAVWAIVITFLTSFLTPQLRMTLSKFYESLREGALGAIDTALACAAVGFIVGSILQTGLAFKLSSVLIAISQGNLAILLVLTMITSLILGMGLPTVACYLVLAVMVGPALIKMGVLPIAAHLFIFYFGIISAITPPVALAAYVGAGIAGAKFLATGITATRLGSSAFILPFMFVYGPQLILQGHWVDILESIVTATIGVYSLSISLSGFFLQKVGWWEKIPFGVAAILLIIPEFYTDMIGLAIFGITAGLHLMRRRALKSVQKSIAILVKDEPK
jgi:TRAP transporter 4TM/12TM fusion protein